MLRRRRGVAWRGVARSCACARARAGGVSGHAWRAALGAGRAEQGAGERVRAAVRAARRARAGHGRGAGWCAPSRCRAARALGVWGRRARGAPGGRPSGAGVACPGGEACSVGARSGEQGARGGRARARRARQRRKEGERGRKKMGKRKEKEKEKRREENGKRREGERDPRRDHGADRGACRPRLASGRARVRRAGRGKTGCWIRVPGLWGIGRSGGTGKIPETGVRVSRRDLELNDEAEF